MEKDTSEIAKLTERISKDPKSKLFVPLAEEYKKNGDIEMAIHVLTEGLKSSPAYVSARAFLGRLLLEKGELAASQSEFEEVVKAIPDNLLAQRKLGDINVLQNKQDEALKHYKIVLALNPKDADVASLVSNIEGGIDVKALLQSKLKTSPEQAPPPSSQPSTIPTGTAPVRVESPVQAESKKPVPVPSGQGAAEPEPSLPPSPPPTAEKEKPAELFAEAPGVGAGMVEGMVEEEAEEVLVVEPLEDAGPEEFVKAESAPFGEHDLEVEPGLIERDQPGEAIIPAGAGQEEPSLFPEMGSAEQGALIAGELTAEPPTVDKSSLEADDFTTDTLAELYIAQGFFEKAIDIYERMLADNPTSRGLKDKLVRVRAMAGPAPEEKTTPVSEEKSEVLEPEVPEIFAEAKEYVPPPAGEQEEITLDADLYVEPQDVLKKEEPQTKKEVVDIFAESREYQPPPPEQEEWPGTPAEKSSDEFITPPQESGRGRPSYAEFEPREYIPPTAKPREAGADEEQVTPAARKKTIDRLETWLSNIKKEK